jgi:hypothetical protein
MATTEPSPPLIPIAPRASEPEVETDAGSAAKVASPPKVRSPRKAAASSMAASSGVAREPEAVARPKVAAGSRATRAVREPRGVGAAGRRGQAPAAGYAHIVWARIVAVGGLVSVIGAVVAIFATTTGGSTPLAPVAARATGLHARYWIVRPGQTLLSIASREQAGLADLLRLNPQLLPGSLRPGQRVRLPD